MSEQDYPVSWITQHGQHDEYDSYVYDPYCWWCWDHPDAPPIGWWEFNDYWTHNGCIMQMGELDKKGIPENNYDFTCKGGNANASEGSIDGPFHFDGRFIINSQTPGGCDMNVQVGTDHAGWSSAINIRCTIYSTLRGPKCHLRGTLCKETKLTFFNGVQPFGTREIDVRLPIERVSAGGRTMYKMHWVADGDDEKPGTRDDIKMGLWITPQTMRK